jgi:hypothetical protein
VPIGWTDDGTTLKAPNGMDVVMGFRARVLHEDITKVGFLLTELSQVIEVGPEKGEQHQKHSISQPLPRDVPQKTPEHAPMNPVPPIHYKFSMNH